MFIISARKRIGLLVPSSNTVMEVDFYRHIPQTISVHTSRMCLENTTIADEEKMIEYYFPHALRDVIATRPDVVVFGCTSAGALRGNKYDEELCKRIESEAGCPAISTIKSVREKLASHSINRLLVFTPYIEQLNIRIKTSLEADSIKVACIKGLDITDNHSIGMVEPRDIINTVVFEVQAHGYDGVFISCTNFRAFEVRQELQHKLNIPVITSNQAVLEKVMDTLNTTPKG